jgi:hypothetical protein
MDALDLGEAGEGPQRASGVNARPAEQWDDKTPPRDVSIFDLDEDVPTRMQSSDEIARFQELAREKAAAKAKAAQESASKPAASSPAPAASSPAPAASSPAPAASSRPSAPQVSASPTSGRISAPPADGSMAFKSFAAPRASSPPADAGRGLRESGPVRIPEGRAKAVDLTDDDFAAILSAAPPTPAPAPVPAEPASPAVSVAAPSPVAPASDRAETRRLSSDAAVALAAVAAAPEPVVTPPRASSRWPWIVMGAVLVAVALLVAAHATGMFR